jgi:hypothetical protein
VCVRAAKSGTPTPARVNRKLLLRPRARPAIGWRGILSIIVCAYGVETMKRLRVLLCALVLAGLGCASEGSRAQWEEVWKDLRGDNMKMRNDFSGRAGADDKR